MFMTLPFVDRFTANVAQFYNLGLTRGLGNIPFRPLGSLQKFLQQRRLDAELSGLHPDQAKDVGIDPRALPPRHGEPDPLMLQAIGWTFRPEQSTDNAHRQRR